MEEIEIGNLIWISLNLNVNKFCNGDIIFEAKTKEDWKNANNEKIPAWCYYDNVEQNGRKYGKLYNWYAVVDPRGLAPVGWRIPMAKDWDSLIENLGGIELAGDKIKKLNEWNGYEDEDDEGNLTGTFITDNSNNFSGFSALAGGFRHHHGMFFSGGDTCIWWSNDPIVENCELGIAVQGGFSGVNKYSDITEGYGLYVRPCKDV